MSSDQISVHVEGLSKRYEIYSQPVDRLKQMVLPKVRRWAKRADKAYYHEFWALRDVSFDIRRGETVGIVGRNGSGKSTLLQLVCGTLTPTFGAVEVRGRVAALLELGSGFNPEFTGRENVYLNAAVLGLTREEIDHRFDAIAAFADIGEFLEHQVKTYSSGMYVRLAFAVAINVDPEILVVDEALSVGDEAFQRKCFARINAIRNSGTTVLFVSHSAGTVVELCDRAILLDGGELISRGPPKFVVSRYHKLMFAPADKVAAIRREILLDSESCEHPPATSTRKQGPRSDNDQRVRLVVEDGAADDDDSAHLDAGLVPRSTLRYETCGARIEQPHIETLASRRVNVLRAGGEYLYTYDVSFQRAATGVRFGMMIKTVTGLELGGAASSAEHERDLVVVPGQRVRVGFRFRAMLAPGVYFLNAGVTAVESDGETFLDRIVDAAMFRIASDPDRKATGLVDFQAIPYIRLEQVLE
ncbi:MAG TPA: ABC transporter ATP-binding protein [Rhodanobacteraceae bacterium]|nr:ABC transporter ATP-binding protein [Rhodanobacteraceae bacterium]